MKGTRWSTMVATGLLLGLAPAAAESSMRKFLEGRWVGDGLQIRVDQDAVQANDNPEKPFEWSPLNIRDVTGGMIVFQIGSRQYIGLIDGQQMTVTITGSSSSHVLTKVPPSLPVRQGRP